MHLSSSLSSAFGSGSGLAVMLPFIADVTFASSFTGLTGGAGLGSLVGVPIGATFGVLKNDGGRINRGRGTRT
ncbi:MAG: hypothetical protein GY822_06070 [Deltaproteobacteria bacterium]|nr:hypothetical protein [Deltaproteobacteria bacterium]